MCVRNRGSVPCLCLRKDHGDISAKAVPYLEEVLLGAKTFKVEAKRADKAFPLKSPEICAELGGILLDAYPHLSVDVRHPDVTVMVEIRDTHAFVHGANLKGAGGLPVGSSGKALLLLSGGIDSPVAGYRMARRGVHISAIHYVSPPYTSDRAQEKVEQLCQELIRTAETSPFSAYRLQKFRRRSRSIVRRNISLSSCGG